MQRVFFVKNGDLERVNTLLQKGATIKSIHAVSENVAAYGYAGGRSDTFGSDGSFTGDIYAYIVVEFI